MTDLIEQQIASERLSMDEGRERFLKQQERIEEDKGYGSRDDVMRMVRDCLPKVTEVISSSLKSTKGYGNGSSSSSLLLLKNLDAELLALVALSTCFSSIAGGAEVITVCFTIGRNVENELWAKTLKEQDAKLYARLTARATKTHGSARYRLRAIKATAAKEGFKVERFPNDLRVKLGEPLLNAVLTACPNVFETYTAGKGKKTSKCLGLTEEASNAIAESSEAMSWMHPVFKPMVVPPKPWEAFDTGCYLTPEMQMRTPLVRTFDRKAIRLIKDAIKSGQMQPCLDALNAIQATPFRINKRVFEIMTEAYNRGVEIEGFPQKHHIKRPERPANYDDLAEDLRKGWRIEAAQVALRNRSIDGDRVTFVQDLAVANSLIGVERFYLPHSLDFRGRVYPVSHFSHQRADHIKALFEFADGMPLGEYGPYWLAIHLANVGDGLGGPKVSKLPFENRIQWVADNEQLIQRIADSPWQHKDDWMKADKPFQFLAACLDYNSFLETGDTHVSHLPIALDGSNSGLQHYSAALRSSEGKFVNLVPGPLPVDIYQLVADAVEKLVQADASPAAKLVLREGVTRKLVKRNTMTFPYSSEEYGFRQQHMSDTMRPLSIEVLQGKRSSHPYALPGKDGRPDGGFAAAALIANKTWTAITHIVRDAQRGMKFFQDCAKALAHESKGLTWVTPVGLPVTHRYTEWDTKVVKMYLYDKSVPVGEAGPGDRVDGEGHVQKQVRVTVRTDPKRRIDKGKAKSAVAPNVIHSQDASHLMLTVLAAIREGITCFALIHDSFATHAAKTNEFFRIIREAFADMYENFCPFTEIYTRTVEAIDDATAVPSIPAKGELDVQLVTKSLYAFA